MQWRSGRATIRPARQVNSQAERAKGDKTAKLAAKLQSRSEFVCQTQAACCFRCVAHLCVSCLLMARRAELRLLIALRVVASALCVSMTQRSSGRRAPLAWRNSSRSGFGQRSFLRAAIAFVGSSRKCSADSNSLPTQRAAS